MATFVRWSHLPGCAVKQTDEPLVAGMEPPTCPYCAERAERDAPSRMATSHARAVERRLLRGGGKKKR